MVDKNSDKHEKKSVLTLGYREKIGRASCRERV